MPRPRSEKAAESDKKVLKALAGLQLGLYSSCYKAVKETGASEATVSRRFNGGKTCAEAREVQQMLSSAQEKALVSWTTNLTATGIRQAMSL